MTAPNLYPESRWPLAPVGSMVQLENGFPFDSGSFSDKVGVPLVRIRDLLADSFGTYVPPPVPERVVLQDGDLVIGMDGEFNVVRWTRGRAALNQRLCRLRGLPHADIRFVEYSLPRNLQFINATQFATTVKHLSSREILNARIPLPPLEEQRRIADFLDDQTTRINNITAARQEQITLNQERLDSWLAEQITNLAQNGTAKLRRFYDFIEQGDSPNGVAVPVMAGEVGVLKTSAIKRGMFDAQENKALAHAEDFEPGFRIRRGDLLIVRGSGSAELVADVAVARLSFPDQEIMLSDLVYRLRGLRLEPDYVCAVLLSSPLRAQIRKSVRQGSGPAKVRAEDIAELRIPTASRHARSEFRERYWDQRQQLEELADSLARSIELFTQYKQSLISAAVSGEFDVTAVDESQLTI